MRHVSSCFEMKFGDLMNLVLKIKATVMVIMLCRESNRQQPRDKGCVMIGDDNHHHVASPRDVHLQYKKKKYS